MKETQGRHISEVKKQRGEAEEMALLFEKIIDYPGLRTIIAETDSIVHSDTDGQAYKLSIKQGDIEWFLYKLRKRDADGPGWKPGRLTDWDYSGLYDIFPHRAVEESTYWLDPREPLEVIFTREQARFIRNPFECLEECNSPRDLEVWNTMFTSLFDHPSLPFPGFFAQKKIPGLRRYILDLSVSSLRAIQVTHLTAVPTWFHTSQLYEHLGFTYVYNEDALAMEQLIDGLKRFSKETKVQLSWRVMRQFWIEKARQYGLSFSSLVPNELVDVQGATLLYPLTPERNIWMQYLISND